jgi:hypothetical protein
MKTTSLFLASSLALAAACDSDESSVDDVGAGPLPPTARDFTVKLENVAPWIALASGTQAERVGTGTSGPLGPGEAFEVSFTAGKGQKLSFVAMLGESNDWFFAPGEAGITLHGEDGQPLGGDVTAQVSLWDSGTEIDEEPAVGASTGQLQRAPDAGAADPTSVVRELGDTVVLSDGSSFALPAIADMVKVTLTPGADRAFTLRVENVSDEATLVTSAGARAIHVSPLVWALHIRPAPFFTVGAADRGQGLELVAESGRGADLGDALAALSGAHTPLSPGVFAVHRAGEPLFTPGSPDRGQGLERIAEDGNPEVLADSFAGDASLEAAGVFHVPLAASGPGPAQPGQAFELSFRAEPGDRLSLATMFGMSNDWFFATPAAGLALFDESGAPLVGDVTAEIGLYDAGTEIDEELAIGASTGPQQPAPDSGAADGVDQVRRVTGGVYGPSVDQHLRVTVSVE